MSGSIFMLSLTAILAIFLVRKRITEYINEKYYHDNTFQSEWLVYILTILLIIVVGLGMLMDTGTKGHIDIGGGLEKLESSPSNKPHPMFDVNIDIFK